jgi:hypothetical protein
MLSKDEFVNEVLRVARERGYTLEYNARNGRRQIDFGHKKLHTGHLEDLYPAILHQGVHIPSLIEHVAPGRPCSHRPMREIIEQLRREGKC